MAFKRSKKSHIFTEQTHNSVHQVLATSHVSAWLPERSSWTHAHDRDLSSDRVAPDLPSSGPCPDRTRGRSPSRLQVSAECSAFREPSQWCSADRSASGRRSAGDCPPLIPRLLLPLSRPTRGQRLGTVSDVAARSWSSSSPEGAPPADALASGRGSRQSSVCAEG